MRSYPSQFWVLVLATLVYVGAAGLGFPFEAIYLHNVVHASMTAVGLVFGVVPATVIPLQFWGGQLTDRIGRRSILIFSVGVGVVWFVGFAFATQVWQVAILTAVESAFGWPLFLTASNAMVADLLPSDRRQEGFSINRVAVNVGAVVGPALAVIAFAWGASYRELFLAAAVGCAVVAAMVAARITESRPASVTGQSEHRDEEGRMGYHIVLRDRTFIVFCLVAVLPVFCIGTFISIYSVYIIDYLHVPRGDWAGLLALNALIVAVIQYPLVRATRLRNRMVLLAVSSVLLAIGIGGAAFAVSLWSLVILVIVMSVGETLLSPVASAEVAELAPEAIRGRYMGVWTVVWNGGAALGPAFTGFAMDAFGARQAFAMLLVEGLVGGVLFFTLAPGWRRRRERPPGGAWAPAEKV
jgi:MFS family permease